MNPCAQFLFHLVGSRIGYDRPLAIELDPKFAQALELRVQLGLHLGSKQIGQFKFAEAATASYMFLSLRTHSFNFLEVITGRASLLQIKLLGVYNAISSCTFPEAALKFFIAHSFIPP